MMFPFRLPAFLSPAGARGGPSSPSPVPGDRPTTRRAGPDAPPALWEELWGIVATRLLRRP